MDPRRFRLVVTSGPTREWMDPVRFLSNASSGRTGWCLASQGQKRFGEVELITGPVCPEYGRLAGARITQVESTTDMAEAVRMAMAPDTVLIMAAAPADYTPAEVSPSKVKKTGNMIHMAMRPTVDVLGSIAEDGDSLERFYRVGFAAETGDLEKNARDKLLRKRLDFICGNEVFRNTRGFGERENSWVVYGRQTETVTIGPADKLELADRLLGHLIDTLP